MGERKEPTDKVFPKLPNSATVNIAIRKWTKAAGINKHITFHCARHTFAVVMLNNGTDIYTVSKLLGHRLIATTQVYAKIIDKTKQDAVANMPNIM